jgi:catechol 2,3-dioxygenase-like lactoylglutathione lyase family enzyme
MVQHVTLEVRREQGGQVAAFWELLGFARVDPPPSLADRAAWLQHGATQIHLMWVEEPAVLPRGHVAVVLEDWERDLENLRAAGHEVEPRREHWGSPRAYVHDPAGNLVELMAFPPG